MLYDILIIDDDFCGEESDSEGWSDNACKLLFDLTRDNLRATGTSGENDDLGKFTLSELSSIRYIFLDLHLQGITEISQPKQINSKLIGILEKINPSITTDQVTCFINSKYVDQNYGYEGQQDLENKLQSEFTGKYCLEVLKNKNELPEEQKEEIKKNQLEIYAKTLIINKALDVENIFDEKLKLSTSAKEKIDFQSKYLVFQSQCMNGLEEHKHLKKKIQLLQQIRNKLAHSAMDELSKIPGDAMKKLFWEIQNGTGNTNPQPIKFENFESLKKYLDSLAGLCKTLKGLQKGT